MVRLLEGTIGKKANRELVPMQPGDVPATYANVDDLMRDVGFRPLDADRRGDRTLHRVVPGVSSLVEQQFHWD